MFGVGKKAGVLAFALMGGALATSGCFLFAAGAGAGGAIYLTDNGAESVVAAPVDQTLAAARHTFQSLSITESRTITEHDGGIETRTLQGKSSDRDVSVNLKAQGDQTKVEVTVKKSPVTWDKDFAKEILSKIVEETK